MRLVSAAFLFSLLVTLVNQAHSAPPKKITSVEGITEYSLDNGLRVLIFPDDSRPKVTVSMTVFVGSRHEGYGETGMAHLLEHMVFKGTPKNPLIPKALQEHGAQFNGTTNTDRTNYFETLTSTDENLEFAIQLEADRLVNSRVLREDLFSEMTVVRNEFERGENSPSSVLGKRMMAAAYEWHNYGKTTIGNRSDIERVPIENLQAFYRKFYQPDNAMVVVAGKLDEKKTLDLIQKYFGAIPRPERKLDTTYTEEPEQDGERVVTLRRVGDVPLVGVAWHIPAGPHADFPALQVLANILDDEPSGRAYKALVQSKKASSVSTFARGQHDPGLFFADAEVAKDQSLDDVKETLISIVEKVSEEGVTDAEVNRSKGQILKMRELAATNTQQLAIQLSEWAAQGDWRLYFLNRDALEKVTAEQVKSAAGKYFKRSNRTVGLYIPTAEPERVPVPSTPDVEQLVKDYKGRAAVAAGEAFDFSPKAIEARVKRTELVPGAKIALLPKKTRGEEVFFTLTLHYGNDQNLKGMETATGFLAPLMLRGTKHLSQQEMKDELDKLKATLSPGMGGGGRGGRGGPAGGMGSISFSIHTKKESLPAVLEILRQVLREPLLPADEFEVMRRERLAAMEAARTEPSSLASQALVRTLAVYPPSDVRYNATIDEQIERVQNAKHEQVLALYRDYLGVSTAEISIVGDFDPEPCLAILKDTFAGWKAKQPFERIARPIVELVEGKKHELDTPDKANAVYSAGMLLPISDDHPDYPALVLGNFILGAGSLSSRLGDRVRQKEGLSYGVGSSFVASTQDDRANLMLTASCQPQNIGKLETVIKEELDRLLAKGVTEKEVENAKQGYLQQRQVGRSSDQAIAGLLNSQLYEGRTMAREAELEEKIAALTAEQVSAALKKHVDPKRLVIVTAGDRKTGGK
jgi:zinc protease